MYRLTIRKQVIKTLQRMRSRDARRVRGELDKLAQNPGGRDIDVTPLRVGPWRVILDRDEEARKIDVLRIGPRGGIHSFR